MSSVLDIGERVDSLDLRKASGAQHRPSRKGLALGIVPGRRWIDSLVIR